MKIKFEWEKICDLSEDVYDTTYRAKVKGGWIIRHFHHELEATSPSSSMVFISDQNHEWEIVRE